MMNRQNTTIKHSELNVSTNRCKKKRHTIKVKDVVLVIILVAIVLSTTIILKGLPVLETSEKGISQFYLENNIEETGSANVVTSVVVNFRGFDTLGEVTVLFLAATGVGALVMLGSSGNIKIRKITSNQILRTGSKYLFPILLLYGAYIIIHGHLSPGGGFQGGVVIATAFLMLFLSYNDYDVNHSSISILESLSGSMFVVIGLVGLLLATTSTFLGNFLPHEVTEVGKIVSAGIIPIIYALVGVKVGSEMTGLIQNILE